MKTNFTPHNLSWTKPLLCLLIMSVLRSHPVQGQATVAMPLAMGADCGGGGNNFKVLNYNTATRTLTSVSNCAPDLYDPATGSVFSPSGGSISFNPVDQMVYYIETTDGNNSVIWRWTPGTCPTNQLAPIYSSSTDFIVGLEYNTEYANGYQVEFSGSSPYTVSLRRVTGFNSAGLGPLVPITFPPGITINSSSSDYVITPTGKMYLIMDDQAFSLDYSTYDAGYLNAVSMGSFNYQPNYIIGLAYANGKLIGSSSRSGRNCSYKEIDFAAGTPGNPIVNTVTGPQGSAAGKTFTAWDMATMITGVGAAKKVSSVTTVGNGQYKVQYDVKVRNYGNVNLVNVQVADDLKKVFGASVLVSASAAGVGTLPSGITVNPAYNGSTDINLLAAGCTMKASPPDSATIRITAIIQNPILNFTYLNSAIASANGALFNKFVTDSSMNSSALEPDPNGNAVPDDPGEGVPTPLRLADWVTLANAISDFNGASNTLGNYLHWTLQNQQAGSTIQVLRSSNGRDFTPQTSVIQQPGSNADYSWQDSHLTASVNYYRILLITPSGEKIYSETVALRNTGAGSDALLVSPNPFRQSVNLTLQLPAAGKVEYRLIDLTSRVLQTGQFSGQPGFNSFTISQLGQVPAGTYILQILSGNDRYVKKLIKL